MNRILKDFKKHSKKIWGNSKLIDQIEFGCKIRKQKNMMSLAYASRPKAYSDMLFRVPKKMNLYISERSLKLPKNQFQQLLKHEAIHIGHSPHDENFRRVAKKHGIPMTLSMSEGGGYSVQIKVGSRYRTVKTHKDLNCARAHAKQLVKEKKGRVRVIY